MGAYTSWTEEDVALLTKLLPEGLSLQEIGKRLNRSRSSVQTKLRALRLKQVPNPNDPTNNKTRTKTGKFIKQQDPTKRQLIHRAGPVTLPPLASLRDVC